MLCSACGPGHALGDGRLVEHAEPEPHTLEDRLRPWERESCARCVEGGAYFEAPRWHDGRWWVSDFYRHGVFAITPDGAEEQVLEVEGQPSGLGWLPDGSLLVVSMRDHALLRRAPDGDGDACTPT